MLQRVQAQSLGPPHLGQGLCGDTKEKSHWGAQNRGGTHSRTVQWLLRAGSSSHLLKDPLQVVLEDGRGQLLRLAAQDIRRPVGPLKLQELFPAHWRKRRRAWPSRTPSLREPWDYPAPLLGRGWNWGGGQSRFSP